MDQEAIQQGASEIIKVVANALENAITTYGPQAVDLAMMVYRIEAAQNLLYGAMIVALFGLGQFLFIKKWWPMTERQRKTHLEEAFWLPYIFGTGFTGLGALWGLYEVVQVKYWLAVFGYPEVYMAIKALSAGGLM